ncbi:MAG: penicillin-binding transpeptidase domain-containing protein [Acutalibacteraceae bacterium]
MSLRTEKRRSLTVFLIIGFAVAVFILKLFDLQVISADEEKNTPISSVTVDVSPIRGEILDRNGYPLVTNKQVNKIIFTYSYFPTEYSERNKIILELITIFDKYKAQWNDELPIEIKDGQLSFVEDMENSVSYLKSEAFLHLNYYATVENCFDALVEKYELESYTVEQARDIASVYYSLVKNGFNTGRNYVFASDVTNELASVIMEKTVLFPGVELQIDSQREYPDGTLAPHILGTVGVISEQEYAEKKDKGYSLNDYTGKSGIEYAYEDLLQGKKGEKIVTIDSDGTRTEEYTVEPEQGDTVILTIDKDIQKVTQNALDKKIAELQQTISSYKLSGAAIVMDVKDNSCLAIASNPNYDNSTYLDDYDKLVSDPNKPLWNRALDSTFTPGSTIKPAVSMAGLEEGVITKDTRILCEGRYTYYSDYQPGCTGQHGNLDVRYALCNSCNIFFYETARLLGIEKLNKYFTMFGLGEPTGIELYESEGTVDTVELRESMGEMWTPGLTIQAGIGHGNNMFTPIQLCSYVSTIANRGIRYKAHVVKGIKSADSKSISRTQTQILSKANFKEENWNLVYEGMYLVATESYLDFSNVPVKVGVKTGTTTVEKEINGETVEINNGFIIGFAPFDNPEIAVAIAVESAGMSAYTAPILAEIFEYYFTAKDVSESNQQENVLLS